MTLVGWAETPTYNRDTHKLYWAKESAVRRLASYSELQCPDPGETRCPGPERGLRYGSAGPGQSGNGRSDFLCRVRRRAQHYTDFVAGTDKVRSSTASRAWSQVPSPPRQGSSRCCSRASWQRRSWSRLRSWRLRRGVRKFWAKMKGERRRHRRRDRPVSLFYLIPCPPSRLGKERVLRTSVKTAVITTSEHLDLLASLGMTASLAFPVPPFPVRRSLFPVPLP